MLYVTTRSQGELYPALRTLGFDRGMDGGAFVPIRLPEFSREEIEGLKDKSFGCCLALVLNKLFLSKVDGVELDFALGRNAVKLTEMSHRVVFAELWHNIHWEFDWVVRELTQRLRAASQQELPVTEWTEIAIRIAVLFGVFGQLLRSDSVTFEQGLDVAAVSGDFTMPIAAWYAREMGLPIGNIVCCDEKSGTWDLLHHGQVRTAEKMPAGLERLIFGRLGAEETGRYVQVCEKGGVYALEEDELERLQQGMFVSVVSLRRTARTISNVYSAKGYLMGPETAVAYAGLQDYRATAGEGRLALILARRRPVDDVEAVAAAIGMDPAALKARLD